MSENELIQKLELMLSPLKDLDFYGTSYIDVEASFSPEMKQVILDVVANVGWISLTRYGESARKLFLLGVNLLKDAGALKTVISAADKSDITDAERAVLDDRLNRVCGFQQKYGTQLLVTYEVIYIVPLVDVNNINDYRSSVGLAPFEDFVQELKTKYRKPVELLKIKEILLSDEVKSPA